jgi:hypothetical protein
MVCCWVELGNFFAQIKPFRQGGLNRSTHVFAQSTEIEQRFGDQAWIPTATQREYVRNAKNRRQSADRT